MQYTPTTVSRLLSCRATRRSAWLCLCIVAALALCLPTHAQEEEPQDPRTQLDPEAIEALDIPGITIDVSERRVDVQARICMGEGLLEVIACTEDSREHESIVVIETTPTLVHAALLLLAATPGSPAMVVPTNEEQTRFRHVAPHGDPVVITLVVPGEEEGTFTEYPIAHFIRRAVHDNGLPPDPNDPAPEDLPTPEEVFSYFVFAGSLEVEDDQGNRHYLADLNGNVVSISTFGDETLCLPWIESRDNGMLTWEVNGDNLPVVGTEVTLRLTLVDDPAEAEALVPAEGDEPAPDQEPDEGADG